MALHPIFPISPDQPLIPEERWFPAVEALRSTACIKLLPLLVDRIRNHVRDWRKNGYCGASPTLAAPLRHWFETGHLMENAKGFEKYRPDTFAAVVASFTHHQNQT